LTGLSLDGGVGRQYSEIPWEMEDGDRVLWVLDALLEAPKDCFLVRRRDSRLESWSPFLVSSFKNFSLSFFSLAMRFNSLFLCLFSFSPGQDGETQVSDLVERWSDLSPSAMFDGAPALVDHCRTSVRETWCFSNDLVSV